MRKVSIIGIGETKIGKLKDKSLTTLVQEAGNKALVDAGIDRKQIEALYVSNFNGQFLSGQGHMGPLVAEALQLPGIPSLRLEGACASGSIAFRQAYMAVAAGFYDMVLVGGVEKMTHQLTEKVTEGIASAADYDVEGKSGMPFPAIFAMIANRYHYQYTSPREAMTVCAVQNHANAFLNPDAQLQKIITASDVLEAQKVAHPFTVMDCSLISDGAAFMVLAADDITGCTNKDRRVSILGSGHNGSTLSLHSKSDITTFEATLKASKEAYDMANVKPADINLVEVHDCFTITQIINVEDLGFAEKGQGFRLVMDGETSRNGRIPVNVSGGLKAKGHPIGATGLSQIYEIVIQLRGEAGERQLKKVDLGMTQNLGGSAGTCLVHIFGRG